MDKWWGSFAVEYLYSYYLCVLCLCAFAKNLVQLAISIPTLSTFFPFTCATEGTKEQELWRERESIVNKVDWVLTRWTHALIHVNTRPTQHTHTATHKRMRSTPVRRSRLMSHLRQYVNESLVCACARASVRVFVCVCVVYAFNEQLNNIYLMIY